MAKRTTKDDFLKEIGQIVVRMTSLEEDLRYSVGALIGYDQELNSRITAGESIENLLRLLSVLFTYRIRDEDELATFDLLLSRLNQLTEKRNRIIHDTWYFLNAATETIPVRNRIFKKKRSKRTFTDEHFIPTIEELGAISDDAQKLKQEVRQLIARNFKAIDDHMEAAGHTYFHLPLPMRKPDLAKKLAEIYRETSKKGH